MKLLIRKNGVYLVTARIVGNPLEFYYPTSVNWQTVSGVLWPQITITPDISETASICAIRTFDVEYSDEFSISTIDGEGNLQNFTIPFEVNDNFIPTVDMGVSPENVLISNLGSLGQASLTLDLELFKII